MNPIKIIRTDSSNRDFTQLTSQLDLDLLERNQDEQKHYDQHNIIEQNNTVLVIYDQEKPIACGCFKHFDNQSVEIKRMFVSQTYRGKGISKIVLKELENWALELGYSKTVLETGKKQLEAIGLYKKSVYKKIENYGQYANLPNSVCFEKNLTPQKSKN